MDYAFREIEKKWQAQWTASKAYETPNPPADGSKAPKPKFYVLDMFPYPSGTGLHVGHPLGYIASDIYARYKRLKGFNVLHPMGYDAFGLPAEQYAIDHGIHPAISTAQNIKNFRAQLDKIGFCYDWSREVNTAKPAYYKWTQWIFLQLFNSWFNRNTRKAEPLDTLMAAFASEGSGVVDGYRRTEPFSAGQWTSFSEKQQQDILMEYRLAFCGFGEVNWCEALGTVLANDEVINGLSERGGFPVVRKKLRQWYLRITDYADRLLEGLDTVDFSDAMKEMQSNWVGKSYGAEIRFAIREKKETVTVYTTRPDTIFGVDFLVLAPEHEIIRQITTTDQQSAVDEYIAYVKSRSERERMAEKKISGCFTGAFAENPFNGAPIPIWISEYVLAGYGTGAIMAVPCGDERDFKFAHQYHIPITNIIGSAFDGKEANPTKDAVLEQSGFLDGMVMRDAIKPVIDKLEEMKIGHRRINYKMRDAAFSRQRYWGEPFPIRWINGIAYALPESDLPLELPVVDSYKPGPDGEGPLANIESWTSAHFETNTMPGYAGSSWYFLRYMDPHNETSFCDRRISDYWNQVDLYIGGTEHAVGHLLYSRMWTKFLFDRGWIGFDEPYKKLVNQGMIVGQSFFTYADAQQKIIYPHQGLAAAGADTRRVRIPYAEQFFDGAGKLDPNKKKAFLQAIRAEDHQLFGIDIIDAGYEPVNGFDFDMEIEKMSKSKFNTVDPDDIINRYGADTFRMYEMFLGPVEQSKPWDTKGIEGVHRFLRKLWRLFYDEVKGKMWTTEQPTDPEMKVLHRTIKKIGEDTERFSFNTAVSALMIGVNDLGELKCYKKEVLSALLIILSPYAPHICEELWHLTGHESSILDAPYPVFDGKYLTESAKNYPVAINGKTRTELNISLDATQSDVEALVLADEVVKKWLEGKAPKKVIYVKNKMINVVI